MLLHDIQCLAEVKTSFEYKNERLGIKNAHFEELNASFQNWSLPVLNEWCPCKSNSEKVERRVQSF